MAGEAPRTVLAFWSRSLDEEPMSGRIRSARAIRRALDDHANLVVGRLPCVLTEPSLRRAFGAAAAWAWSFLKGPTLPVQCMMFADRGDLRPMAERLDAEEAGETVVYLDGVRGYPLLEVLRRRSAKVRIVVDFDDLMSRRMALLLEAGEALSPGYLSPSIPSFARRMLRNRLVGSAIVRFERATLEVVERRCLELADAIVLVSPADAKVLANVRAGMTTPRAEIVVIPPPARPTPPRASFAEPPRRFVFVGSDALTQNRLTIDYLRELWRTHRPSTPLVIYGRQKRPIDYPAGVEAAGYVDAIDQIYDGRSVLICPSFLGGGVKTKALEAFAHGAPVIGNGRTFEGLALRAYGLQVDDEAELISLILHPDRHSGRFAAAAAAGFAHVTDQHSPEEFAQSWRDILLGAQSGAGWATPSAAGRLAAPASYRTTLPALDLNKPLVRVGEADG